MTACVDCSFFDSCANLAQLNFCVLTYTKTVFLTISLCFCLSYATNLHDDSFYSIMPVWQLAIVFYYLCWRISACYVSASRHLFLFFFYCLQRRYWTRSEGYKWAIGDVRGDICQKQLWKGDEFS
jgi:hypothetical protein